jgi:type I restriction enzyme R subunit
VLQALLDKYQDEGVIDLGDPKVLRIAPFAQMGTPVQLVNQFGSRAAFEAAVHEMQAALYEERG